MSPLEALATQAEWVARNMAYNLDFIPADKVKQGIETIPVVAYCEAIPRPGPKCKHASSGILSIGIRVCIITFKMRGGAPHFDLSFNS